MATEMAPIQVDDQVDAFEHEGNVAQHALVEAVEAAAQQAL
jgi:hypothetical protein